MTKQVIFPTVDLPAAELKFLRKLWNCEGYRSDISELSPTLKTPTAKRDRICRTLAEKGLVEYDTEIFRFALSAPGRMLLSLQTTSLPVTPDELNLLRTCRGSMTPAKLGNCVPQSARQSLINELVARKLLKVVKTAIAEVRLTPIGQQVLQAQLDEKPSAGKRSARKRSVKNDQLVVSQSSG